jgi:hypothetical protein
MGRPDEAEKLSLEFFDCWTYWRGQGQSDIRVRTENENAPIQELRPFEPSHFVAVIERTR